MPSGSVWLPSLGVVAEKFRRRGVWGWVALVVLVEVVLAMSSSMRGVTSEVISSCCSDAMTFASAVELPPRV